MDTHIPQPSGHTNNVIDEAVHKELGNRLVMAATTASSLEAEQDSGSKKPWGILLLKLGLRVYLNILMIHYSQEKTKTNQRNKIDSLKRRVKKLERRNRSRTHKLKRLYKVTLTARVESSRDEESLCKDASKQGRRIDVIDTAQVSTVATTTTITTEEITLAQALKALKTSKPKAKGIVFQEPEQEQEITKKKKVEDDREKAELKQLMKTISDEEEVAIDAIHLAVKSPNKDITLVSVQDDADIEMFDVDMLGGEEMFVAEQNNNVVEEIVDAAQVSSAATTVTITTEELTLAQALEALKTSKLKAKGIVFLEPEMFDRAFKRVNTFEDYIIKLVERKDKRAREELEQEITKKKKVEDNREKAKLKQLMETVSDEEEVAINAIPLAVKSPEIVD
nr:hypothetical protein [Tanacetum cinerariifolium]